MDPESCPDCQYSVQATERICPSCGADLGAPNVRQCGKPEERVALRTRYKKQRGLNRLRSESDAFCDLVRTTSSVVVTIPAGFARDLFESPQVVYQNYDRLVGSGVRRPADERYDRMRQMVGGAMFGALKDSICYGNLALGVAGLQSYGSLACRLRPRMIRSRTTFLEMNSYTFARSHLGAVDGTFPPGHRAVWDNRHMLAFAKLAPNIEAGQTNEDWSALLVRPGSDRADDDFVEAHVFGTFTADSVEDVGIAKHDISKEERLDLDIAVGLFSRRPAR